MREWGILKEGGTELWGLLARLGSTSLFWPKSSNIIPSNTGQVSICYGVSLKVGLNVG